MMEWLPWVTAALYINVYISYMFIAFLTPPPPCLWCSVMEKRDDRIELSYQDGTANIDLFGGKTAELKGECIHGI